MPTPPGPPLPPPGGGRPWPIIVLVVVLAVALAAVLLWLARVDLSSVAAAVLAEGLRACADVLIRLARRPTPPPPPET